MRKAINYFFLLSTIFIYLIFSPLKCYAVCPPFFAFIDKDQSTYSECLQINGGTFCGGDLEVKNNCSSELILENKEIPAGTTEYGFKKVRWDYNSKEQNKQKWELRGIINNKEIIVRGQTENWENKSNLGYILKTVNLKNKDIILLIIGLLSFGFVSFFIFKKNKSKKP